MALSGSQKAYQYAIAAGCRSGTTRSDYYRPFGKVTINGTVRSRMVNDDLRISDALNDQPNLCNFTCQGFTPVRGQEIVISLGTSSNRIFAGHILTVSPSAPNKDQRVTWTVDCVDYTWLLQARRITGRRYTNSTPSTIIADLMTFAPSGFTSSVETGLDNVAEFTTNHAETLMQALVRLMKMASKSSRKGGYVYVDYNKVVTAYVTPPSTNNPVPLRSTTQTAWDIRYAADISQSRTRTFVLGGTTQTSSPTPNTSTAIPVLDTRKFNSAGGYALSYGNQLRYTGTSPTSGPGWITGVTSFAYSIPQGESVRVLTVSVNSSAATSMAAILGSGDGLIDHVIEDERYSDTGAQNRGDADVSQFCGPIEDVSYKTRDKFTISGRTLAVSLTAPTTAAAQLIVQSVDIMNIGLGTNPRFPLRKVTAGTLYKDVFDILDAADQASAEGAV